MYAQYSAFYMLVGCSFVPSLSLARSRYDNKSHSAIGLACYSLVFAGLCLADVLQYRSVFFSISKSFSFIDLIPRVSRTWSATDFAKAKHIKTANKRNWRFMTWETSNSFRHGYLFSHCSDLNLYILTWPMHVKSMCVPRWERRNKGK